MENPNPFTPVFGMTPAHMAGRKDIIAAITRALDAGTNSPDIASLLVGARGTGKTALLTHLSTEAQRRGWITADVTAGPGMLDEVLHQSLRSGAHIIKAPSDMHLSGVQVGNLIGVSWNRADETPTNWRLAMSDIFDQLAEHDAGLLITVDEIDPRLAELRQLVNTFQHFIREGRKTSLLLAGLPHNVSLLVSERSTTFLRRAARHNLGPIPDYDVEEAFRATVRQGGRSIGQGALSAAVRAIDGFPFMLQLVGYRAWDASPDAESITEADMEEGIRLATAEMKDRVYDATLAVLAPGDISFLQAMLADEGATRQSDLRERLGKSSSHVSTYKRRLLDQGIIDEPRKGVLRFCLPGFRSYLVDEFGC